MLKETNKKDSQQKKEKLLLIGMSVVAIVFIVLGVRAFNKEVPTASGNAGISQTEGVITTLTSAANPPVESSSSMPQQEKTTVQQTTAQQTTAAQVDETEEILKVVYDSVNKLKSADASFTGHKVQNIDMKLTDCSVPSMTDFVNKIISAFIKEEVYDYDFTNGVAQDPENGGTTTSNSTFPPVDKAFSLTRDGVASAKKEVVGENTVYSVKLVAETSTLENPRPPYHNSASDTLDLSSVDIPVATITKADFEYPGATISVTLDPDGQIVAYREHLDITGTGEAKALGMSGYGTLEGYMEENWEIQWK